MQKIAVDMDEVIADFLAKQIRLFNENYDFQIKKEDLLGKNLDQLFPQYQKALHDMVADPNYFADLGIIEGAQEALWQLSQDYEVFITTAAMEFPTSFTAKYEWLAQHFDFIPDSHYVFCGQKSILGADYLIDDNSRHFQGFNGKGLLFSAPHNLTENYPDRLDRWEAALDYFYGSAGLSE